MAIGLHNPWTLFGTRLAQCNFVRRYRKLRDVNCRYKSALAHVANSSDCYFGVTSDGTAEIERCLVDIKPSYNAASCLHMYQTLSLAVRTAKSKDLC